jgi:TonB family protein
MSEVDEKPKLTKRPIPSTDGRCENNGLAQVRVVLLKSGEIGKVEFIKASPCAAFNQNALKAAKQIKFKPAMKDGKTVSVYVKVIYTFARY